MKKILIYIIEHIDIIVFNIVAITLLLLMRSRISVDLFGIRAMVSNILILIAISSPMWFLNKKSRYHYGLSLLVILLLLVLSQVVHYLYFTDVYSFTKIALISELFSVKSEITSKIDLSLLIFLIPIFLYVLFIKLFKINESINRRILNLVFFVFIIIISSVGIAYVNSTVKDSDNWTISDVYLYDTLYSKTKMIDRFGFLKYIYRDLELITKKNTVISDPMIIEEINDYLIQNDTSSANYMTGIFEGKNLILILAESLSYGAINETINPNLYKLANEGIYFTNNYAPKYLAATGDSEFISLTSMLPSVNTVTAYEYHRNKYPYALPNLFKNKNYSVSSFHNYISNFYNRETFHQSLGFDVFYDMDKLNIKRFEGYTEGVNWPSDIELFEKMMLKIDNNNNKPFFNFVITVSGHMPYKKLREELRDTYEYVENRSDYSEEVTSYFAAQHIFDQAIEVLLNELDEQDLLNNTVIVIYGDHYPYGLSDEGLLELNDQINFEEYEKYKAPLIIWSSDIENKEIERVTSTFDIYPTICNLFNLETGGEFVVGNDIFSFNEGIVYFPDMSWITDHGYYDMKNGVYTKFVEIEEENYLNQMSKKVAKIFEIGDNILVTDYYAR